MVITWMPYISSLDLAKAFDKVEHGILLHQFQSIGDMWQARRVAACFNFYLTETNK